MTSPTGDAFMPSDDDSCSTNSTPASSPRSEYAVDAILAEKVGKHGAPIYLVRWEDYPLHRATWEPAHMFTTDIPLQEWKTKKSRIAQGLESEFDINDFDKSVEEEKVRRKQRRLQRREERVARSFGISESVNRKGPGSEYAFSGDEDVMDQEPSIPLGNGTPVSVESEGPQPERDFLKIEETVDEEPSNTLEDATSPLQETIERMKELFGSDPPAENDDTTSSETFQKQQGTGLSNPENESHASPQNPCNEEETSRQSEKNIPKSSVTQCNPNRVASIPGTLNNPKYVAKSKGNPRDRLFINWGKAQQKRRKRRTGRDELDPNPEGLTPIDLETVKPMQSFYPIETREKRAEASDVEKVPERDSVPATAVQPSAVQGTLAATLILPTQDEAMDNAVKHIRIKMHGMEPSVMNALTTQTGPNPVFHLEHMALTTDYRDHAFSEDPEELAQGSITPDLRTGADLLHAFAHHLKHHLSGALFFHENFTMIVCGVNDVLWQFLPWANKVATNAKLRFYIHKPIGEPPSESEPPSDSEPPSESGPTCSIQFNVKAEAPVLTLFREILDFTPKGFFTYDDGKIKKPIAHNVFLMYHPGYEGELELLTKFFVACKANVYTPSKGGWKEFCRLYRKTSGVIIFPSEFVCFHLIPDLYKFLTHDALWSTYQIGCNPDPDVVTGWPIVPTNRWSIIKLFPEGGMVLLTDEVIMEQPLIAAHIIMKFVSALPKEPMRQAWHLVARPNIVGFLDKLLDTRRSNEHFIMWHYLRDLPWSNYEARSSGELLSIDPAQPANLITPDPVVYSEYDDQRENDPAFARTFLAEWFAEFTMIQAEAARKFYIVVPDAATPEAKDWQERMQHLAVVPAEWFVKTAWPDVTIDQEVAKGLGL